MLSEHGAAESPVVTSPSARASVTCETPTPRSWTKSTRTMINWWIPREPPLDCSTNSCTSLFFAPGSRIQECNTRMDTFLLVEPNTEPRMKRPLAGSLRFSFKKAMREELKEQFRIISWKNKIVMKRNPGELTMDILFCLSASFIPRYPLLFLAIMVGISMDVKNVEYPVCSDCAV